MTALPKSEMTIFSTESQREQIRTSSWYAASKHRIINSESDFDILIKNFSEAQKSIFVAYSTSVLKDFVKYLLKEVSQDKSFEIFHNPGGSLISFQELGHGDEEVILNDIFKEIVLEKRDNLTFLNREELMFVLNLSEEKRADRIIGVQVLEKRKMVKILRGNFEFLYAPMSIFKPTTSGVKPNFDKVAVKEYGHYIAFGEYEVANTAILYECDKSYRLRRKKERLANEKSFGACLRRFRLQKKIKQTDFKNTSEKTIRRIEAGDRPTPNTMSKILKELGITEEELLSF